MLSCRRRDHISIPRMRATWLSNGRRHMDSTRVIRGGLKCRLRDLGGGLGLLRACLNCQADGTVLDQLLSKERTLTCSLAEKAAWCGTLCLGQKVNFRGAMLEGKHKSNCESQAQCQGCAYLQTGPFPQRDGCLVEHFLNGSSLS